jgi:hypothetical protein
VSALPIFRNPVSQQRQFLSAFPLYPFGSDPVAFQNPQADCRDTDSGNYQRDPAELWDGRKNIWERMHNPDISLCDQAPQNTWSPPTARRLPKSRTGDGIAATASAAAPANAMYVSERASA